MIEEVVARVAANARAGESPPIIYARLEGSAQLREFRMLRLVGDARAKSITMFNEGRTMGIARLEQRLEAISFATGVNLSPGPNPTPGAHLDGVLISLIEATPPCTEMYRVYVTQRAAGRQGGVSLVELKEAQVPPGGLVGGLAWLCGWRSRRLSSREVERRMPQGMRHFLTCDPDAPR